MNIVNVSKEYLEFINSVWILNGEIEGEIPDFILENKMYTDDLISLFPNLFNKLPDKVKRDESAFLSFLNKLSSVKNSVNIDVYEIFAIDKFFEMFKKCLVDREALTEDANSFFRKKENGEDLYTAINYAIDNDFSCLKNYESVLNIFKLSSFSKQRLERIVCSYVKDKSFNDRVEFVKKVSRMVNYQMNIDLSYHAFKDINFDRGVVEEFINLFSHSVCVGVFKKLIENIDEDVLNSDWFIEKFLIDVDLIDIDLLKERYASSYGFLVEKKMTFLCENINSVNIKQLSLNSNLIKYIGDKNILNNVLNKMLYKVKENINSLNFLRGMVIEDWIEIRDSGCVPKLDSLLFNMAVNAMVSLGRFDVDLANKALPGQLLTDKFVLKFALSERVNTNLNLMMNMVQLYPKLLENDKVVNSIVSLLRVEIGNGMFSGVNGAVFYLLNNESLSDVFIKKMNSYMSGDIAHVSMVLKTISDIARIDGGVEWLNKNLISLIGCGDDFTNIRDENIQLIASKLALLESLGDIVDISRLSDSPIMPYLKDSLLIMNETGVDLKRFMYLPEIHTKEFLFKLANYRMDFITMRGFPLEMLSDELLDDALTRDRSKNNLACVKLDYQVDNMAAHLKDNIGVRVAVFKRYLAGIKINKMLENVLLSLIDVKNDDKEFAKLSFCVFAYKNNNDLSFDNDFFQVLKDVNFEAVDKNLLGEFVKNLLVNLLKVNGVSYKKSDVFNGSLSYLKDMFSLVALKGVKGESVDVLNPAMIDKEGILFNFLKSANVYGQVDQVCADIVADNLGDVKNLAALYSLMPYRDDLKGVGVFDLYNRRTCEYNGFLSRYAVEYLMDGGLLKKDEWYQMIDRDKKCLLATPFSLLRDFDGCKLKMNDKVNLALLEFLRDCKIKYTNEVMSCDEVMSFRSNLSNLFNNGGALSVFKFTDIYSEREMVNWIGVLPYILNNDQYVDYINKAVGVDANFGANLRRIFNNKELLVMIKPQMLYSFEIMEFFDKNENWANELLVINGNQSVYSQKNRKLSVCVPKSVKDLMDDFKGVDIEVVRDFINARDQVIDLNNLLISNLNGVKSNKSDDKKHKNIKRL